MHICCFLFPMSWLTHLLFCVGSLSFSSRGPHLSAAAQWGPLQRPASGLFGGLVYMCPRTWLIPLLAGFITWKGEFFILALSSFVYKQKFDNTVGNTYLLKQICEISEQFISTIWSIWMQVFKWKTHLKTALDTRIFHFVA